MKIKARLVAAASALVLALSMSAAFAKADKSTYMKAFSEAKMWQKKAASVGGEWRDIGKFLKQAEEAAKKGDYETAIKLAEKARFQGEMGYKQALDQKDAGPRF
jgi:uncharacterized protein YabN with tetrapyrrole methylase and pyrophosphatase domain